MVKKLIFIINILLMSTICYSDILVLKLGTRGIGRTSAELARDWRDGQIIEILNDDYPLSSHMTQHFLCVKVTKHFTGAEKTNMLSQALSGGNLVRRRNYYLDIVNLPTWDSLTTTQKDTLLKKIYAKTNDNGVIDATAYNISSYIKVSTVTAQTVNSYDTGGSISTGSWTIGPGQNYTTIATFEADLAAVLMQTTSGYINVNYADTTVTTFLGTITVATSTIYVGVNPTYRHNGVFDGTKSSMTHASDLLVVRDNFCTFEYMQFVSTYSNNTQMIYVNGVTTVTFRNCIFNKVVDATSPANSGTIFIYLGGTGKTCYLVNNVIYGNTKTSGARIITGGDLYSYNNTVYGVNNGYTCSAGSFTITNSVAFGNTNDFSGTVVADYCATDDDADRGTNGQDLNENAGGEWTASFTDYANFNFSVKNASSLLYNTGTTLANVTTDCIGTVRPQSTAYDIGAFEFPVSGGAVVPAIYIPKILILE